MQIGRYLNPFELNKNTGLDGLNNNHLFLTVLEKFDIIVPSVWWEPAF